MQPMPTSVMKQELEKLAYRWDDYGYSMGKRADEITRDGTPKLATAFVATSSVFGRASGVALGGGTQQMDIRDYINSLGDEAPASLCLLPIINFCIQTLIENRAILYTVTERMPESIAAGAKARINAALSVFRDLKPLLGNEYDVFKTMLDALAVPPSQQGE